MVPNTVEGVLAHHGVLGQRWGHHKLSEVSGTSNSSSEKKSWSTKKKIAVGGAAAVGVGLATYGAYKISKKYGAPKIVEHDVSFSGAHASTGYGKASLIFKSLADHPVNHSGHIMANFKNGVTQKIPFSVHNGKPVITHVQSKTTYHSAQDFAKIAKDMTDDGVKIRRTVFASAKSTARNLAGK